MQVDEALVDLELELVPGLGTFTTRLYDVDEYYTTMESSRSV